MSSELRTITRHIADQQQNFPDARGEFSALLGDIATAAKLIASRVSRAGLLGMLGDTGDDNVQGERVQKLDRYADQVLIRFLRDGGHVGILASEEREHEVIVEDPDRRGPYAVLFDPLDGSSNIDVNVSIGTIFSIFRRPHPDRPATLAELLRPGREIVAAGYVIYGSGSMFVYSAGNGVHGFTLDPAVGEFLLSHEHIRMPDVPEFYSVNEGHSSKWAPASHALVARWKEQRLSARYIGSLVADFHRNLLRGGVFYYPATFDAPDESPKAKLRLLYEAAPLAFLAEQAGGLASDGRTPILDLQPRTLHQRVPLLIGNARTVQEAESLLRAEGDEAPH